MVAGCLVLLSCPTMALPHSSTPAWKVLQLLLRCLVALAVVVLRPLPLHPHTLAAVGCVTGSYATHRCERWATCTACSSLSLAATPSAAQQSCPALLHSHTSSVWRCEG